jgi:SPP1 family predicted phage head-tail adaptor
MNLHLNHRIAVMAESRATVSIGGGCYTTSWTTSSTVWANCQVLNNTSDKVESHKDQKKQQYTQWKVITRADVSITNKNRIIFDSRILTVETVVDPTARNRRLEIVCREEVV